jgi:hypothetical protein
MKVHRASIMAFGLLVLSEYVAFRDGNNQVEAQVAQPAEHRGEHKLGDPTEIRDDRQDEGNASADKQQDTSQIGSSPPLSRVMSPTSGVPSRPHLQRSDLRDSVCLMIETAARAHDLPPEFLARVIWQESRFRPDTVGPRRRHGQSAQGIAQFMPSTAVEKGLLDPFDPMQALPKAAQFLRELKDQFGNLGLAAAAYNAGSSRVRAWLAGMRGLPDETRKYVAAVTGVPADQWAKADARKADAKRGPNCADLMALLQQSPPPQELGKSPAEETVKSRSVEIAKNDLLAAPAGPVREDLVEPQHKAALSRASPQASELSLNKERSNLHNAQLAKNNPVENVVTLQQEALHSRGDMKQAASPRGPSSSPLDAPGKSIAQIAKNDPMAAQADLSPSSETNGPGRFEANSADGSKTIPDLESESAMRMCQTLEDATDRFSPGPSAREPVRCPTIAKGFPKQPPRSAFAVEKHEFAWVVQLIGSGSEAGARAEYQDMQKKYGPLLAAYEPIVLRTPLGTTASWYRVRLGATSRESAERVCAELSALGVRCLVQRN